MLNLVSANDYFLAKKKFQDGKLCIFKNFEILEGRKPFECDPQLQPNYFKENLCRQNHHSDNPHDQTLIDQIIGIDNKERESYFHNADMIEEEILRRDMDLVSIL